VAAGPSVGPGRWLGVLDELMTRIGSRFSRVEPRRRARAFVLGLLAELPRKNCWTIAEHAGDPSPDGMQHPLARAKWDADGVRDDVRGYVIEHLGGHCCVGRSRTPETGVVTARSTTSAFAGFRFPPEVISIAVRWYLRYGLSYRDVEELLAERSITVDHVTIYRWVQRFTPEFIEAARPCRHRPGDRWFVDETYVKVAGKWTYLYRAVDQYGQVIDVLLSTRRDLAAARRFFTRALRMGTLPAEVTTDRAPAYLRVLDKLIPSALHVVEQYANNPVEADHGRLKARLRPMRGLRRRRSARILAAGHAFVQNLRRGH
jgi:transposase, IS6 family